MDIQNIKINNYNISYADSKFKQIIEENKHLLPNMNKQSISFDIINSNEAFANAIRRVFNDELPTKCLEINYHNVVTNDKFILIGPSLGFILDKIILDRRIQWKL